MSSSHQPTRSAHAADPVFSSSVVNAIETTLAEQGAKKWCFGAQWSDLGFRKVTLPSGVWVYNDKWSGTTNMVVSGRNVRIDFSVVQFPTVRDKPWRIVDLCNHAEIQAAGADDLIAWVANCLRLGSVDPLSLAERFSKYGDKQSRNMARRAFKLSQSNSESLGDSTDSTTLLTASSAASSSQASSASSFSEDVGSSDDDEVEKALNNFVNLKIDTKLMKTAAGETGWCASSNQPVGHVNVYGPYRNGAMKYLWRCCGSQQRHPKSHTSEKP